MTAPKPSQPVWAIVSVARATYLKPLYEGFAEAQTDPWSTLLVLPEISAEDHAHPIELTTPVHARLHIHELPVKRRTRQHGTSHQAAHFGKDYLWLPQTEVFDLLAAHDVRGVIVHEFSPFTLMALLFAKWRGLPVVYFGDVGQANARSYSWKTRLWHRFWTLWVDARMAGCPAARLTVSGARKPCIDTFHAVDSTLFRPFAKKKQDDSPVVFVFSGQLIARKGIDLWFAAAAQMLQAGHSHFRLRIVGGGDESWARACAESYGVAHLVEWCGFLQREAMREAIGTGDVFVLPSRWDSYAVVTHEAACMGLPLLISCHAGSAEALVIPDVTGWQITPEDSPAFAARMIQMMDQNIRSKMSTAAREFGEQLCARRRGAALWHWLKSTFPLG